MPEIELIKIGYKKRRRRKIISAILAAFFVAFLCLGTFASREIGPDGATRNINELHNENVSAGATFLSLIGQMKDTLYTNSSSYLEVRLDSQRLYRHWRDGTVQEYKISTGTERLDKGIETRMGIFLIQNKIEWLYSLQFDSTKVFNWLGFNWGIGFHSLEGRRYYWNLGRRPSSHGCIRLSKESAEKLFETVSIGTPVFVHKGNYARLVAFQSDNVNADTSDYSSKEVLTIYENRLSDLYRGKRLFREYPTILLSRKYIGHNGIPIGDGDKVPERQRIPPLSLTYYSYPQFATYVTPPDVKRWIVAAGSVEKEKVEQVVLP